MWYNKKNITTTGMNHFLLSNIFTSSVSFEKFSIITIEFVKEQEDKIKIKENI